MIFKHRAVFYGFLLMLTVLTITRIVSTYPIFNQTIDEPAHIAAGLEWIDNHTYIYEPHHPPLSRIALAMGPYLNGVRLTNEQKDYIASMPNDNNVRYRWGWYYRNLQKAMWSTGNHILYSNDNYFYTLSLARMGNLIFLVFAIILVWYWTRDLYDRTTALIAVGIFTTLPPVLAHAGVATTDMTITATLLFCTIAFTKWLAKPNMATSLLFGVAGGLAVLSKFSALLFFPLIAAGYLLWRWAVSRNTDCTDQLHPILSIDRVKTLLIASLAAFIVIWAGYQFSVGPIKPVSARPHEMIDNRIDTSNKLHDIAYKIIEAPIIPAPELVAGIKQVTQHNKRGHKSYLLGEVKTEGWWYFFPVVLAVKIPIAILLIIISGIAIGFYRSTKNCQWSLNAPVLAALAILAGTMFSNINIGVRHILPAFPFLAIVAAYGVTTLWRYSDKYIMRIIIVLLGIWHLYSTTSAHPDYLSYFNEFAGDHPENVLITSDLDWGQDLQRLSNYVKQTDIEQLNLVYQGTADITKHSLPDPRLIGPDEKVSGWVAATILKLRVREGYEWLEQYEPKAYIGKTFRLYYVPEKKDALNSSP